MRALYVILYNNTNTVMLPVSIQGIQLSSVGAYPDSQTEYTP